MKNSIAHILGLVNGFKATWQHLVRGGVRRNEHDIKENAYFSQKNGPITIQYPHEKIPVPEVGRYQLEVIIDDCIVCDLCAKICPVNCIDIAQIKSAVEIGKTSDGSSKRLYAANFEIDMAKCMYCGLCTTVCPTECIIMTDNYDRTSRTLSEFNYQFAEMTEAEAVIKRAEYEQFMAEKAAAKAAALSK